jgi:hypothetical protein
VAIPRGIVYTPAASVGGVLTRATPLSDRIAEASVFDDTFTTTLWIYAPAAPHVLVLVAAMVW